MPRNVATAFLLPAATLKGVDVSRTFLQNFGIDVLENGEIDASRLLEKGTITLAQRRSMGAGIPIWWLTLVWNEDGLSWERVMELMGTAVPPPSGTLAYELSASLGLSPSTPLLYFIEGPLQGLATRTSILGIATGSDVLLREMGADAPLEVAEKWKCNPCIDWIPVMERYRVSTTTALKKAMKAYVVSTDRPEVPTDTFVSDDPEELEIPEHDESGEAYVDEEFREMQRATEWLRMRDVLGPPPADIIADAHSTDLRCVYSAPAVVAAMASFVDGGLLSMVFVHRHPRKDGFYPMKLFYGGEWRMIVIDDCLPFEDGVPLFGDSTAWWALLVERAMAKLYGGYEHLTSLTFADVVYNLTGMATHADVLVENSPTSLWGDYRDVGYWKKLRAQLEDGQILAAISFGSQSALWGLVENCPYPTLEFFEAPHIGPSLCLYNPHRTNPLGPLSIYSDQWSKDGMSELWERFELKQDGHRYCIPLAEVMERAAVVWVTRRDHQNSQFAHAVWHFDCVDVASMNFRRHPPFQIVNPSGVEVVATVMVEQANRNRHAMNKGGWPTVGMAHFGAEDEESAVASPAFAWNALGPRWAGPFIPARTVATTVVIPPQGAVVIPSVTVGRQNEMLPTYLRCLVGLFQKDSTLSLQRIDDVDVDSPRAVTCEVPIGARSFVEVQCKKPTALHVLVMHEGYEKPALWGLEKMQPTEHYIGVEHYTALQRAPIATTGQASNSPLVGLDSCVEVSGTSFIAISHVRGPQPINVIVYVFSAHDTNSTARLLWRNTS